MPTMLGNNTFEFSSMGTAHSYDERGSAQSSAGHMQQDGQGLGLHLLCLVYDTGSTLHAHHA